MKGGFFIKKIIILIIIVIVFILINYNKDILIPSDAIRFRVIANSNSEYDQEIKMKVKEQVEDTLYKRLNNIYDIDIAKDIIKTSIPDINDNISKITKNNNFNINLGLNYFPEKKYKGVTYKSGKYDSLVITLGSGNGNNWWCVLFPPLCLIDSKEDYKSDDVQYKFFIKELIDKYFN